MRFRFIEDRRADYPVTIMCEVLAVSPAGYYAWRSRPESRRSATNRELVDDIKRIHRDTSGRYGSRRIHAELKAQGRGVSRGRIERLMRHHGIRAIMARPRRVRTTDSRHDFPIAPNLLDRNFTATAPNRIWLVDITYVETDQGWLYLATILDLYSRKIVGWAMCDHLRTDLPLAALRMAISAQRPGAGLIHHSDRGVQYASEPQAVAVRRLPGLDEPQGRLLRQCPDGELLSHPQNRTRPSPEIRDTSRSHTRHLCLRRGLYNRTRHHSAIGYISPIEMELKAA
jgi:putative transposase